MNKAVPTALFLLLLSSCLFAQRTEGCFPVTLGDFYASPVADAIVVDDGGYYILVEEDYYESGYDPYAFLMRFDRKHNLLWKKNVGQTYGYGANIFKGPNRTVYCALGASVTKYGENGGALLNLVTANSHNATFVREDPSGNIMVSGTYYDYFSAKYYLALSSFTPTGTSRWPVALLPISNLYLYNVDLKILSDGSALIFGQSDSKQVNYGKVKPDGTTAFNLKIDALTYRVSATSIAVATDGFYIMATQTKADYTSDAYMYKTDLNGAITRTTRIAAPYNTSNAGFVFVVDNVNPIISYYSVSTPSYASNRGTVSKLTSTGTVTWTYSQSNTNWNPLTIQTDASGNLYIPDYWGILELTSAGTLYDQVASPSSLTRYTVTSSGDIYMLNDAYTVDCFLSTLKRCTAIGTTTNISAKAVCPGATTDLQYVANGKDLSYQWMKDGNVVFDDDKNAGTKASKITIKNFSASDVGDYTCVATDNCGKTVTSAVAKLSLVAQPLTITSQPASKLVCSGTATTTFAVVATGGTNIKYQWTKNGTNMSDAGNASGTKAATLTLANVAAADAATYACTVVNDCNTPVNSVSAILTIAPGIQVTKQPVAQASGEGVEVVFSLEASGTGLTYQWKKNGTNVTNGTKYAGATSSVLTVKGVACGDAGSYSCTVSATCGAPVNSSAVALTVNSDVVINRDPVAQKKCAGETATMIVQATGANLTYSWSKGSTVLSDGGHYAGTKTSVLTITGVSSADVGSYSCVVSGGCSITKTSQSASLDLTTAPVLTSQSTSKSICTGGTMQLNVVLSDGSYTYQWLKNNSALTSSANITGVSSASLFITNISVSDAGTYTCKVTGCGGQSTTSSPIVITITAPTAISTQPVATTFCEGGNFSLTVSATSNDATYQWTKDGVSLTDNGHISGAKTSILKITGADADLHQGYYSCEVKGSCGTTIASNIVLVLGSPKPDLYFLKEIDCFDFTDGIEAELIGDHEDLQGTFKVYRENSSTALAGFQSIDEPGDYEIVKTTSANCSDTLKLTISCVVTGLADEVPEFTLSPNPTRGTVTLIAAKTFVSYQIANVLGSQLLNGNIIQSNQSIDLKHLPDGLYLFVIKNQDGSKKVQKLILER